MKILSLICLMVLLGCVSPRGERDTLTSIRGCPSSSEALWLSLSDFRSTGVLYRLGFERCQMEKMIPTSPMVRVVNDGSRGFFLLHQMVNDGLHVYDWPQRTVIAQRPLKEGLNPQAALRDQRGRVWVVGYDSNSVEVFSPDLKDLIKTIDGLDQMGEGHDPFAELSHLAQVEVGGRSKIAVVASRLMREPSVWVPEGRTAVVLVDTEDFSISKPMLVELSNALWVNAQKERLTLVGSGDLSLKKAKRGGMAVMDLASGQVVEQRGFSNAVVGAGQTGEGALAFLEWDREGKKSCLIHGGREIACAEAENGYAFSHLAVNGGTAFVAYAAGGNSELWVISLENGSVERSALALPVAGLVIGP